MYKCPNFVDSSLAKIEGFCSAKQIIPVCRHLAWSLSNTASRTPTLADLNQAAKYLSIGCTKKDDASCFDLDLVNKDIQYKKTDLQSAQREQEEIARLERKKIACESKKSTEACIWLFSILSNRGKPEEAEIYAELACKQKTAVCLDFYSQFKRVGALEKAANYAEIACGAGNHAGCTFFSSISSQIAMDKKIASEEQMENRRVAKEEAIEEARQAAAQAKYYSDLGNQIGRAIAGLPPNDEEYLRELQIDKLERERRTPASIPVFTRPNRRKCITKQNNYAYGKPLETVCEDE